MTSKWPQFVTADLGDSENDQAELMRRWSKYDREMKTLISKGGVHQDEDGWWVEDGTGELIGPDPEVERPRTNEDIAQMVPFEEALPDLADSIRRGRGRPPKESPKQQVTLRLDADVLERLRSSGRGWQGRVNDVLKKAVGL